ncbi:hypothetical protein BY996DRAFT_6581479 [Phakopsora pachyrhizi]|nr:hypothetical protein BY996DRAFT_6581479 [Phakopsora pachyrhizi]
MSELTSLKRLDGELHSRRIISRDLKTEFAVNPPPYGNIPSPPSYNSSLAGLSLVDRCDSTFKIYHRDLVYLSKEWA